jgi:hypothetical protein
MELTSDEMQHLVSNLEDFSVLVGDAAQNHFDTISGIDQKFWDAAQKLLVEQGKLKDVRGFGLQQFEVDRPTLEAAAQQSLRLSEVGKTIPSLVKPEDLLAITMRV